MSMSRDDLLELIWQLPDITTDDLFAAVRNWPPDTWLQWFFPFLRKPRDILWMLMELDTLLIAGLVAVNCDTRDRSVSRRPVESWTITPKGVQYALQHIS